MRVPCAAVVNAADDAALTERCRVNAFAAENDSEAVADTRATNAAVAETEAAPVTLASTN